MKTLPTSKLTYLDAAASATALASSNFFLFFSSASCFSAAARASCSALSLFSSWPTACLSFCFAWTALWSLSSAHKNQMRDLLLVPFGSLNAAKSFARPTGTKRVWTRTWLKFHSLVLQQLVLLSQLAELAAYGALGASQRADLAAQVLFNLPAGLQVRL